MLRMMKKTKSRGKNNQVEIFFLSYRSKIV